MTGGKAQKCSLILSCLKELSWTFRASCLIVGEGHVKCNFWLGNSVEQGRSATPFLPTLNPFWYSALFTVSPLLKEQKAIMIFTLPAPVCTMVPDYLLLSRSFARIGLTLRKAGTTDNLATSISMSFHFFILLTALVHFFFLPFSFRVLILPRCNKDIIEIWLKYPQSSAAMRQAKRTQNIFVRKQTNKNPKPNPNSCNGQWMVSECQFMQWQLWFHFLPCLHWLYG